MRYPFFSEFLFAISMVFFIAYISVFNFEMLGRKPLCELDLLSEKTPTCVLNDSSLASFRVVVHAGGNSKTGTIQVPLTIVVRNNTETIKFENIASKSARAGGGQRYHSNLNYGVYDLPKASQATITITTNESVKSFSMFNAKILKESSNYYVHLLGLIFLITLFLSIYRRQKTFVKGYAKSLPYVLYIFVVLLVVTWAL
jgi:hypothetical protein